MTGKLNGVMPATTPTGCSTVWTSMPRDTSELCEPFSRCGMPQANSTHSRPRATSPCASSSTLPCSRVTMRREVVAVRVDQLAEAEHQPRRAGSATTRPTRPTRRPRPSPRRRPRPRRRARPRRSARRAPGRRRGPAAPERARDRSAADPVPDRVARAAVHGSEAVELPRVLAEILRCVSGGSVAIFVSPRSRAGSGRGTSGAGSRSRTGCCPRRPPR